MQNIILIGGGGHCKACIDVIETSLDATILGVLDGNLDTSDRIFNYPVLGNDDDIAALAETNTAFFIAVGQIKTSRIRRKIADNLENLNASVATIISKNAYISKHSRIGKGTIVMHYAVVNAAVTIGEYCIINNKALIEHDVSIGQHTHISTGAIVNGGTIVGSDVFIGSGAVLRNGISVCNQVIIGAGSVVLHNIEEPGVYAGNPLIKIK